MRITKKQLRRVIKEELHRPKARLGGSRKIPHGWNQILPWLTEDSVDDELEHLRSNIDDDEKHIDNLEDDIKDEREEEEHARETERARRHESRREQWGTDLLNLAELAAPVDQDYVDEEGEFETDRQDTRFSTGAEDARLYGEADEESKMGYQGPGKLQQIFNPEGEGVEAEEGEDDLTPISEADEEYDGVGAGNTMDPGGRQREMFDFLTGPDGAIRKWEEHFGVDDGATGRIIWEFLANAYNELELKLR